MSEQQSIRQSNVVAGNANVAPGGLVFANKDDEMAAYDQLGIACQLALRTAMLPWSATTTLAQHRKRGWNPKDPDRDQQLAIELAAIDTSRTKQTSGEGHPIRDDNPVATPDGRTTNRADR